MNKDKITSVRINKEILSRLKAKGMSPQKIVDLYIRKVFKVEVTTKIKERK